MTSPSGLNASIQALRVIAAKSSLKYVDVAAGDARGLILRMQYTARGSGVTSSSRSPLLAAEFPDRRYLIASITKPIVAMTAVQLAADGHLALNDAVRDHLPEFHRGPLRQITCEADRVQRAWGFGWRRNWLDHTATFSDFLAADAIGHWGATGTMMWIDPVTSRWCVILTTQPYEQSRSAIQRMSNVVAVGHIT